VSRWRAFRGHPAPAPEPVAVEPVVVTSTPPDPRRAAAADAAAWLLTHTATPTSVVLDAYLDALLAPGPETRAERLAVVLS
jgi:hypothetical protein